MVTHHRRLSSLSSSELKHLAALLSLPLRLLDPTTGVPSDLWLATQQRAVASQLPKSLLRPHDFLSRLSMSANRRLNLTMEDLIPECAVLCASHAGLNPWLVRRVFLLATEELTARLVSLEKYLARPGRYSGISSSRLGGDATGEMEGFVDRMHALLGLSTGPEVLERVGCPAEMRLPRVEGGCEACVVSLIGGSARALCDLRAGLIGRSHRRGKPVLLRLVDAWIARLGEGCEDVMSESDGLGKTVKRARRAVWKRKHGKDTQGHHHHSRSHGKGGSTTTDRSVSDRGSMTDSGASSIYERREKQRVLMERSLAGQHLSPKEKAVLLSEIEEQLDGMFGAESRVSGCPSSTSKHPSSSSSASSSVTFTQFRHGRRYRDDDNTSRDTVDENSRSRQHERDSDSFSHTFTRSSRADTVEVLIDSYHDDVDEIDESDPYAAERLQEASKRWWDAVSQANEQHPAFRSPVDASAVPRPLNVKKSTSTTGFRPSDDDEPFDPSQWTDISVQTTGPQSRAGARPSNNLSTMPTAMSRYRLPFIESDVRESTAFAPASIVASSVYSNDGPARPHPPPARTVVVETDVRAEAQSVAGSVFVSPVTPLRHGAEYYTSAAPSDVTAWPAVSSWDQQNTPRSMRASPAANDLLQRAADRRSRDRPGPGASFSGAVSEGTVLPGDSISTVGGLHPRVDQLEMDEAFARALQNGELALATSGPWMEPSSDSDSGGESDEEMRLAIAMSKVRAGEDGARRSRR